MRPTSPMSVSPTLSERKTHRHPCWGGPWRKQAGSLGSHPARLTEERRVEERPTGEGGDEVRSIAWSRQRACERGLQPG